MNEEDPAKEFLSSGGFVVGETTLDLCLITTYVVSCICNFYHSLVLTAATCKQYFPAFCYKLL